MSEESQGKALSQVVPVLVAALVCDSSSVDPTTNKKTLIGIFDRITVGEFPTERPVSLYFKITDATGAYDMSIRFVRSDSRQVLAEIKRKKPLIITDRLSSHDAVFPLSMIPLPESGTYEFQIWFNGTFLGSTPINVVQRSSK